MEIRGAVALVTGGAGGIGAALADALRAKGATVVTADLPGTGADVDLDVTDRPAVRAAVAGVVAEHGYLDIAVANAGIGIGGLVEDLEPEVWDRTLAVNLHGVVHTIDAAYRMMIPQKRGSLVVVSSLAALAPTPLLVPYATSKGAVLSLAGGLRPEAARHGIGVTAVCPGPVETPILDGPSRTPGSSGRRYLEAAAGKPLSPAALADAITRGIERDEAMVVPGRARVLYALQRHLPGLVGRIITRNMQAELAAAGRT